MKYTKSFLLLVACTLPFMSLIVSGLSFYLGNVNAIEFNISEVILPVSVLFVFFSAFLFLILFLFRSFPKVLNFLAGGIVGLTIAVWIQSQLLIWNFGQMNGQPINWALWHSKMYFEILLWLLIIVLIIMIFFKGRQKIKRYIVFGVFLLGLISVLSNFIISPKVTNTHKDYSHYKDIFTFNPEKNVLIIILDCFQSDYFDYIKNTYPDEIKVLDGFTFYRNTLSKFPTTKTSIPSVLIGSVYRNEKPFSNYISESDAKFNLLHYFENKSYSTNFVGVEEVHPSVISMNGLVNSSSYNYFKAFYSYIDYAAFRSLPIVCKTKIYNNGNWLISFLTRGHYPPEPQGTDIRFLELFEEQATVNNDKKGSFKILHFTIPHAPWQVDENLQYTIDNIGEKAYIKQARGAVKLAGRIMNVLKALGIYDNSDIIIMSDHGTGELNGFNNKLEYGDALNLISSKVRSASHALLLYKPAKAKGQLLTDNMPLELTDIPCLLGIRSGDEQCREFETAKSGGERVRTFYYYEWDHKYWKSDYLPPITEYIVTGDAYSPKSYAYGKFIYTEKGIKAINAPKVLPYKLGKEIRLSTEGKGEADTYLKSGWSSAEPTQRWTDGYVAGLSFQLEQAPVGDLRLKLLGFGFLANNKIDHQVVTVLVNEVKVGSWMIKEEKWNEVVIPKKLVTDGLINIVFQISNPMAPSDCCNSPDTRKLGICVKKIMIEEVK